MKKNSSQSLILFVILSLIALTSSCNKKTYLRSEGESITFNCKGDNVVFEADFIQYEMDMSIARCICYEQSSVRNSSQIIALLENTDNFFFRNNFASKCDSFTGDRIFEILLSKANNFECYDGSGGHCLYFNSYSYMYIKAIKKMITSIDGLSYTQFSIRLGENTPEEIEDAFFDSIEDSCNSEKIRNKYFLDSLSQYYSEGMIKLK